MCNLKLSVFFIALSVTLSCLEATPIERLLSVADDLSDGTSKRQGWMLPVVSQNTLSGLSEEMPEQPAAKTKSHQLEKRKCNTATCVTQRLADFLVRSGSRMGAVYPPTNVGSNTYGKRDTEGLLPQGGKYYSRIEPYIAWVLFRFIWIAYIFQRRCKQTKNTKEEN